MKLLNRRQFRDRVRRHLGKMPGVDVPAPIGPLPEGEPNPADPFPTNAGINDQLDETLADLNLRSGTFHDDADTWEYLVPATTVNGVQSLPINDQRLDIVRSAWFIDVSGLLHLLAPVAFSDLGGGYQTTPPGVPQKFYVQGYSLHLWPGSDVGGTLFVAAGTSPQSPQADDDTVPELSSDEIVGLSVIVARELAASEGADEVMRSRLGYLGPRAEQWYQQILGSVGKRNQAYTPGMKVRTMRVFVGGRTR